MRRNLLKKFGQIIMELVIDLFTTKRGIYILLINFLYESRWRISYFNPGVDRILYFLLYLSVWIAYIFIVQLIMRNIKYVVTSEELGDNG